MPPIIETIFSNGWWMLLTGVGCVLLGWMLIQVDKKRDKRPERTSGTLGDVGGVMCVLGVAVIVFGCLMIAKVISV